MLKKLIILFLIVFSGLVFVFNIQLSNSVDAQTDIPELDETTKTEIKKSSAEYFDRKQEEVFIGNEEKYEDYLAGVVFVKAKDESEPQLTRFIGKLENGKYMIALQYTTKFDKLLPEIPDELILDEAKQYLFSTEKAAKEKDKKNIISSFFQTKVFAVGSNPDNVPLQLPYGANENWGMTGGPHNAIVFNGPKPWASVDLAKSTPGIVRASANGTVSYSTSCPNFVSISHLGGLETTYYHLTNIQVLNNQVVTANTYLGDISIQSGCGGSASGPHVHFSTRINGSYQDIEGLNFSGWGFSEGNNNYEGCVSNGTITNCLPGTVSYNVNYTNGCNPPISGDWNITSSCDFVGAATAPANVIVNNNSTLRIKNGASLNINMTSNKIVAKPGSRLIIESGGKVY